MGNCLVFKLDGVEKETKKEALGEDLKQKTQLSDRKLQTGEHVMALGLSYRIVEHKEDSVKSTSGVVSPEEGGEKRVRVRVVLSKKELVQLLSRCQRNLGSLVDVIGELKMVSATVSSGPSPRLLGDRWTPALEAIPEDV